MTNLTARSQRTFCRESLLPIANSRNSTRHVSCSLPRRDSREAIRRPYRVEARGESTSSRFQDDHNGACSDRFQVSRSDPQFGALGAKQQCRRIQAVRSTGVCAPLEDRLGLACGDPGSPDTRAWWEILHRGPVHRSLEAELSCTKGREPSARLLAELSEEGEPAAPNEIRKAWNEPCGTPNESC